MFQTTNQCESSKFELIRAHLRMVVTLDDYKKHSLNMIWCPILSHMYPTKNFKRKNRKGPSFMVSVRLHFSWFWKNGFTLHVHLVTAVTDGHSHRQVTQEHLSGKEIPDNILLGFLLVPSGNLT